MPCHAVAIRLTGYYAYLGDYMRNIKFLLLKYSEFYLPTCTFDVDSFRGFIAVKAKIKVTMATSKATAATAAMTNNIRRSTTVLHREAYSCCVDACLLIFPQLLGYTLQSLFVVLEGLHSRRLVIIDVWLRYFFDWFQLVVKVFFLGGCFIHPSIMEYSDFHSRTIPSYKW